MGRGGEDDAGKNPKLDFREAMLGSELLRAETLESLEQCWRAEKQQAAMNVNCRGFPPATAIFRFAQDATAATDCLVQAFRLKRRGRFFFCRCILLKRFVC